MTLEEKIPEWYLSRQLPLHPLHYVKENGDCSCGVKFGEKHPYGKHPLTLNGFNDATHLLDKLRRWNETFPNANWGLRLGAASKICALDIDPRNGGLESLNKLFPNGLPETFTVETGSGGYHCCFKYDPIFARKVKFDTYGFPGIEFLTDGQYIVIPPSNHSQGFYSIKKNCEVIEIPEAIKGYLRRSLPETNGHSETDQSIVGFTVAEGKRNDTVASKAGRFIREGKELSEVLNLCCEYNLTYCRPPLETKEVRAIVKSVEKTHIKNNPETQEAPSRNGHSSAVPKRSVKFEFVHFSEGLERWGNKSYEWLIKDWLLAETTGFIASAPGMFKSYFVYHMAHSVATGDLFLGQFPTLKTGPVFVVNQEDHPSIFFNRTAQIEGKEPYYNPTSEEFSFPYMRHPNIYMPDYDKGMRIDLLDPEMMYAFERDVLQQIPDLRLLTLDPFYSMAPADDYFLRAAYGMNILKDWRTRYKCSIMIVHHSSKAEPRGRLIDTMVGSQFLSAWKENYMAFAPVGLSKTKVLCERGNKTQASYPNVCIDYNITDYTFSTEVTPASVIDTSSTFDAKSYEQKNYFNFKNFTEERIEWRKVVTDGVFESARGLAERFGMSERTARKKMEAFGLYLDNSAGDRRIMAREEPELYNVNEYTGNTIDDTGMPE